MNNLSVTNVDYDLTEGFFWVGFENGKSLQCCLVSKRDSVDDEPYYVMSLEIDNLGHSDGLCADCNEWAVDYSESSGGEWGHISDFLIEQARTHGLQIIA